MKLVAVLLALGLVAVVAGCAGRNGPPESATPRAARPAPDPGERSRPFVIVADTPSGAASITLAAGASGEVAFRVANRSDTPRTFALRSTAPWLTVDDEVQVPPRQSSPVTATVHVGTDVRGAMLRGGVTATAPARTDRGIPIVYESRAPVSVRVVAP